MTDGQEEKKVKRVIQDLSHLSPEERIKLKREEREKLEKEMEAKRIERLAREEEERKRQAELERIRLQEEAKRRAEEAEAERLRKMAEEEERKRQAELEAQRLSEEIKRKKAEALERAQKEKEAFYAQFGITEDGKALDADEVEAQEQEKQQNDQEEDATRRFALEELEFNLDPGEEDGDDDFLNKEPSAEEIKLGLRDLGILEKDEDLDITKIPHRDSCSFCRINKKILKANMLFETPLVLVFLDPKPIHKGQLIITPRGHYASLRDCPDPVVRDLMLTAKLASIALKASPLNVLALSFYWSESVDIPEDERHVYMSAIPRREGDGVTIKFGEKDPFDKSAQAQLAGDLKKYFA